MANALRQTVKTCFHENEVEVRLVHRAGDAISHWTTSSTRLLLGPSTYPASEIAGPFSEIPAQHRADHDDNHLRHDEGSDFLFVIVVSF
jgi:hypothetical protein